LIQKTQSVARIGLDTFPRENMWNDIDGFFLQILEFQFLEYSSKIKIQVDPGIPSAFTQPLTPLPKKPPHTNTNSSSFFQHFTKFLFFNQTL
jgi:hypothetical protein